MDNMNYNNFDLATKLFFNKAMDIYAAIKYKPITKDVEDFIGRHKTYEFSRFDKKILSFFIAGFLVKGNLKNMLDQYDDIKISDLLSFINTEESEIVSLPGEDYEGFYENDFKLEIMTILKERNWESIINHVTPEVVVNSLKCINLSGSEILDYYSRKYLSHPDIKDHPLFGVLRTYNKSSGNITEKEMSKLKDDFLARFNDILLPDNKKIKLDRRQDTDLEDEKAEEIPEAQEEFKTDDNLWNILDEIKSQFIGQEAAVEDLFYNMVNNQELAVKGNVSDGERSIIFMDGPSGTGKTAIAKAITDKFGIPFSKTAVTKYSSTGYKGGDIESILQELLRKAGGNLELAERGIVVFDEFDKLAYSKHDGLAMRKAIQQDLLDFMGGGTYEITVGDNIFNMKKVKFDTSKLTFICLGALTELRKKKTTVKSNIGFGQENSAPVIQEYTITPEDLTSIGIEFELVARLNTYLHTNEYNKKNLEDILRFSSISPLLGFKKLIESHNKQLIIDDDVYGLIAEQGDELKTGARSLQTIIHSIRTKYLKEILRGNSNVIHLDTEMVKQAYSDTKQRKGR